MLFINNKNGNSAKHYKVSYFRDKRYGIAHFKDTSLLFITVCFIG